MPGRLFNALRQLVGAAALVFVLGSTAQAVLSGTAQAAPVKILTLGDSLTAGYGLADPNDAYPAKLEAALKAKGYDATVINGSVSGDTAAGGLARLDWVLGDHPDYALVELGSNDMLRGLPPEDAQANLDKILTQLDAAHVKALLIGMKSAHNWGPDYEKKFDAIYPALAESHHAPLYPFFLDGVALDPKLNQQDMLHPNPAGVDILVARTLPAIMALLGPPSGAAPT